MVVSDFYDTYAPSFKSIVDLRDFAIFLKEEDFVADPIRALLSIQDFNASFIKEKLYNMTVAQAVILPDSKYFVQALINEALITNNIVLPRPEKGEFLILLRRICDHCLWYNATDIAIIARLKFYSSTGEQVQLKQDQVPTSDSGIAKVRFPSTLVGHYDIHHEAPIIVGVESAAKHCIRRQVIRESWENFGGTTGYRAFFLVSGDWDDIADEFYSFGDIIWIDIPTFKKKKRSEAIMASLKTEAFLWTVEHHVSSYAYILKTRDDSYVDMDQVERILHQHRPHYWGACLRREKDDSGEYLDSYASGIGYVLSRKLNHCVLNKLSSKRKSDSSITMPEHEELFISSLARECGQECNDVEWHWNDWWRTPIKKTASGKEFAYINDRILWQQQSSPYFEAIAEEEEESELLSPSFLSTS